MQKCTTILYVDDDPDDRYMLNIALQEAAPGIRMDEAETGLAAMQYLEQSKKDGKYPCLIVLDLNMPILDGKQTFERIRKDESLTNIPVLIFTSSQNPRDQTYFRFQTAGFFIKPSSRSHLKLIAQQMAEICQSKS